MRLSIYRAEQAVKFSKPKPDPRGPACAVLPKGLAEHRTHAQATRTTRRTNSQSWTMLIAGVMVPFFMLQVSAQGQQSAQKLVREVVYNELHDHAVHGNWRYWVKRRDPEGTHLSDQVETREGPVARVVLRNGRPLDEEKRKVESAKLEALVNSPRIQADHRDTYQEEERRVGRIMALLPDAFLFQDAGEVNGCRHLNFRPNPKYSAHTVEERFFHALTGELWVDSRMKRMVRLEGRMEDDLNFGFGLLGRVNKGGWFRMDRVRVSQTEWKTNRLELHLSGRAIVFKSMGRDTSELRGGFKPLPASLTLAQGVKLLNQPSPLNIEAAAAQFAPVALTVPR